MSYLDTYRSSARTMAAVTVSPLSAAFCCAACQSGSGTRTDRTGVFGWFGMSAQPHHGVELGDLGVGGAGVGELAVVCGLGFGAEADACGDVSPVGGHGDDGAVGAGGGVVAHLVSVPAGVWTPYTGVPTPVKREAAR
jgi:hypothetical protein